MSAGLSPALEGRCVCRFNSSPGGGAVSAGLTPVLEGAVCLHVSQLETRCLGSLANH